MQAIRLSTRSLAQSITFALLLVPGSDVLGQPRADFSGLGDLPEGDDHSLAWAVSADGMTVVGYSGSAAGSQAFRWTPSSGTEGLGFLPAVSPFSFAAAVDATGTHVAGIASVGDRVGTPVTSFLWSAAGGMIDLGDFPGGGSESNAFAISADGAVVVGVAGTRAGDEAYRWTAQTGLVSLGDLQGGDVFSQARGVSADGNTIVGFGTVNDVLCFAAFVWTPREGMIGLGTLPGYGCSEAIAISGDGSVVVGTCRLPPTEEAFRWSADAGLVSLGQLPDAPFGTAAAAVSADGSMVVGSAQFGPNYTDTHAVIWMGPRGPQYVQDVLVRQFGLDLTGSTLSSASGISADGSVIVGWGTNPAGQTEGWRAVIPPVISVVSANPPLDNPFVNRQQPFRDVLQTGLSAVSVTQGIGAAGTPVEDTISYADVTITFSAPIPLTTADIAINCSYTGTPPGATPCPSVTFVAPVTGASYTLSLSGPIPPGGCSTLTFAGKAAGQALRYESLPGDVNMSGSTTALDVLGLVAALNNGQTAVPSNLPRYDINRGGNVTAVDVLRLIELLNGANTSEAWTGAAVTACP